MRPEGSAAPTASPATLVPVPWHVTGTRRETHDTVTLALAPPSGRGVSFRPGQFHMLFVPGIGEVPISIAGAVGPRGTAGAVEHTIRAVGAVSRALCELEAGATVGVRGPFGTEWPLERARERDLLLVAGGIGLAPLRPVILELAAGRGAVRRAVVMIGARGPDELPFAGEIERWRAEGLDVRVTVDRADPSWSGRVGVVTTLFTPFPLEPTRTTAFVCGPEVMMRFAARDLLDAGVAADEVHVSVERNMKCALGMCGRCQLGDLLLCRDGPVLPWPRVARKLTLPEL